MCDNQKIIYFPLDLEAEREASKSWSASIGNERNFTLNGKTLNVPVNVDLFNTYRNRFYPLAKYCADKAAGEYIEKVYNLETFMEIFPDIYSSNLDIIISKAVDILIAEGIYDISTDMFKDIHLNSFNLAGEDYATMEESCRLTLQANANATSGFVSLARSLLFKDSGRELFDTIADSAVNAMPELNQINQAQKDELYGRINKALLFNRVFSDYYSVSLSLALFLQGKGKDIWFPDDSVSYEAANVFKNLSNPNFPQDKIVDILFSLIRTEPYNQVIYDFMKTKYGETDEVTALINYFNVYQKTEEIYFLEDFPQEQTSFLTSTEATQSNCNSSSEEDAYQDNSEPNSNNSDKKDLFSFGGRVDGKKVKKALKIGAGIALAKAVLNGLGGNSNSKVNSGSGRQNLFGSHLCNYGHKGRDGHIVHCFSCPVSRQCTQRGEYEVGS